LRQELIQGWTSDDDEELTGQKRGIDSDSDSEVEKPRRRRRRG
jgi:hypothetical protein